MIQQQQEIDQVLIIRSVPVGHNSSHPAYGTILIAISSLMVICRTVLYTRRTHGKATATVTTSTEREEEGTVVLLSFLWFPLDNTLFITPDIQY